MQGKLYPLFSKKDKPNFVLGIVTPESKLLKLDFDTLFNLTQQELNELLIKRSYNIMLSTGPISLSKMEIRTIVQLLKGAHAGEIAKALDLQQTTVESYLLNIRNKLGVDNKSELIDRIISKKILQLHEGIGGKSALISINDTPVFVKKVTLTDLEQLPQHFMSTANILVVI